MSRGISQQILAERIAKDKACLTNLMNNLEKKGMFIGKKILPTVVINWCSLTPEGKSLRTRFVRFSIRFMYTQKRLLV